MVSLDRVLQEDWRRVVNRFRLLERKQVLTRDCERALLRCDSHAVVGSINRDGRRSEECFANARAPEVRWPAILRRWCQDSDRHSGEPLVELIEPCRVQDPERWPAVVLATLAPRPVMVRREVDPAQGVLRPVQQARRDPVVLHREQLFPVSLRVALRPPWQAPLPEADDQSSFHLEDLLNCRAGHASVQRGHQRTPMAPLPSEPDPGVTPANEQATQNLGQASCLDLA